MSKVRDLILELAGGNPGALTVLCELYEEFGEGLLCRIRDLKELRESAIWEVYKDECGKDLTKTAEAIVRRWDAANPEVGGL